jgi:glycyl-tRNA synthetase beta chain
MLLSSLTEGINRFFDQVLVMDKREEIKQNRLSLLKEIWETVSSLADFSKLSSN